MPVIAFGNRIEDVASLAPFPLTPRKLRKPYLARQQPLHEPLLALLQRGDEPFDRGDGLIPRAEDLGDLALLGEGWEENRKFASTGTYSC